MSAIQQVQGYWQQFFSQQFQTDLMAELRAFLKAEKSAGKVVYPPSEQIFNAFITTPLEQTKVVIVGQDPYHGPEQAHGLSFSVRPGVAVPPSLKNIYKELSRDLGFSAPQHGYLQAWAERGVMLLNSVLTVEAGIAASHQKKGWEQFTNAAIEALNQECEHLVFLAWGRHAHQVCAQVDTSKHLVIKTSHPSPLGATKSGKDFHAFLGSGCFSAANRWLLEKQIAPVNWQLPQTL